MSGRLREGGRRAKLKFLEKDWGAQATMSKYNIVINLQWILYVKRPLDIFYQSLKIYDSVQMGVPL